MKYADIRWSENNQPICNQFDDIYFSSESGIEETEHVFIKANQLPERFKNLKKNESFTVGETGFGTGLNFLCAWRCFEKFAPDDTYLHFISTEKYLLSPDDFLKAWNFLPALKNCYQQLKKVEFLLHEIPQSFVFLDGRIKLTLLVGDALETLPNLISKIDAWFLDGFAPKKNPKMWSVSLFNILAKKSHKETTFSTFTVAGVVKRSLIESGFVFFKAKGFGKKREILYGYCSKPKIDSFWKPQWSQPKIEKMHLKYAVVIGSGLAGMCSAYGLAKTGWKVLVLEKNKDIATEASGNKAGVLYTKLSAHDTLLSRLILQGYWYTIHWLKTCQWFDKKVFHQTGVVHLNDSERKEIRHKTWLENFSKLLLSDTDSCFGSGVLMPHAGWCHPQLLCKNLSQHPNITVKTNCSINKISKEGSYWNLFDENKKMLASSEVLILSAGVNSNQFSLSQHIPMKSIRGQVSYLNSNDFSKEIKSVLCGQCYITPEYEGLHILGATFDIEDPDLLIRQKDHKKNLETLYTQSPYLKNRFNIVDIVGGKVGFRCVTPDYFPLIGQIAHPQSFLATFNKLKKDSNIHIDQSSDFYKGLFLNTGHGSRGLITCPLSGEILAALINDTANPVYYPLLKAMNPNRFLIRQLIKNRS